MVQPPIMTPVPYIPEDDASDGRTETDPNDFEPVKPLL